jgi:hypothetical protein
MNQKKRIVVSYDNLTQDVIEAIMKKYPQGYANHVFKVNLPNNKFFHAITVDTADASYLVKVKVKLDKAEKLEEDLFNSGLDKTSDTDDTDSDSADDGDEPGKPE